jgi:sensor histidine kinase YesM
MTTSQILIAYVVFFAAASAINIALFRYKFELAARICHPAFNIILSWGGVAVMFYNLTAGLIILGMLVGMALFGTFVGFWMARKTFKACQTPFSEIAKLCFTIAYTSIVRCFGFKLTPKF